METERFSMKVGLPPPDYAFTPVNPNVPLEFRVFVQRAERQLFDLFMSIDKDGNGKLDKKELQAAFRNAGLTVSNQRLADFFNDMDYNNDGFVTFNEWRYVMTFFLVLLSMRWDLVGAVSNFARVRRQMRHRRQLPRRWGTGVISFAHRAPKPPVEMTIVNDCRRAATLHEDTADGDKHRNFLLFMPAREYDSQLIAVLSFYDSVVNVTPEGDSIVSEELLEGLGTADSSSSSSSSRYLLDYLFGSLLRVAFPSGYSTTPSDSPSIRTEDADTETDSLPQSKDPMRPVGTRSQAAFVDSAASYQQGQHAVAGIDAEPADDGTLDYSQQLTSATTAKPKKKYRLTDFIPDPGYFLAGAIAGGVSRTATAPLDRLKVYLLVNTSSKTAETAAGALQQGRLVTAVKNAARPFGDAIQYIYRTGGLKSFFAGK